MTLWYLFLLPVLCGIGLSSTRVIKHAAQLYSSLGQLGVDSGLPVVQVQADPAMQRLGELIALGYFISVSALVAAIVIAFLAWETYPWFTGA